MATATVMKTRPWPTTPKKRYRFLLEWIADNTTESLGAYIRWFDSSGSALSTITIFNKPADAVSTWQIDVAHLIPPSGARYARIALGKSAVTAKFGIQRLEFKEHDSSLERRMREIQLVDSFCSPTGGELPWQRYNIQGNLFVTKAISLGASVNWSEFGITRLTTGANSGDGGVIHLEKLGYGGPPVGTENRWKLRMSTTTNMVCWLGLWSVLNLEPDVALANSVSGIGFRAAAAGSGVNWFGVVRSGTSETTQNMGVAADTNWSDLGWYSTGAGIQFTYKGDDVGTTKTTNIPTTSDNLIPMLGIVAKSASSVEVDVDTFGLQLYLNAV